MALWTSAMNCSWLLNVSCWTTVISCSAGGWYGWKICSEAVLAVFVLQNSHPSSVKQVSTYAVGVLWQAQTLG